MTRPWRGPSKNGAHNPAARLDAGDVELIRRAHADGATLTSLAAATGVSRTQIRRIVNGEAWAVAAPPPAPVVLPPLLEYLRRHGRWSLVLPDGRFDGEAFDELARLYRPPGGGWMPLAKDRPRVAAILRAHGLPRAPRPSSGR